MRDAAHIALYNYTKVSQRFIFQSSSAAHSMPFYVKEHRERHILGWLTKVAGMVIG